MTQYILRHEHKAGTEDYYFKSNRDDLQDSISGIDNPNPTVDSDTKKVIDLLKIEFEPFRHETIEIEIIEIDFKEIVI